jgi:hypothetical protein
MIQSGLWHYCLTGHDPLLDQMHPVSVLHGSSISSSDRSLVSIWPDMQVAQSAVNSARVCNWMRWTTDRMWIQCVRSAVKMKQRGSREDFEWPDTSGHLWLDSAMCSVTQRVWIWSRPLLSIGRVWSHRPARPVNTKNPELAHNV